MMMAVASLEHLDGHSEEPSRLPQVGTILIIQVAAVCLNVWGVTDLSRSAALTAAAKPLRTERTTLPFHSITAFEAMPSCFQRRRCVSRRSGQTRGGLPFLGLPGPFGAAMEHAALDVDVTAPDRRMKRGAADRGMPGPGVQTNEDEPGDVLADLPLGRPPAGHDLTRSPCAPDSD